MEKIQFMTSLLTFYMKGEISHNGNFINIKIPNQVASTDSSFKVFAGDIVLGLIELFVGLGLITSGVFWGVILLLIGVGTVISAFQTSITLNLSSGEMFYIFFLVFEKNKAAQAINMVNSVIAARMNDTNTRAVAENQTDRLVEAIGNSNKND